MKAMILAAGLGTRMRPLTDHCPKPLLQAGGKALIVHHIERLAAAGIRDVVINTAWLGAQIESALGKGETWGVSIHFSREDKPLETGGGIRQALPLLGAEPFLLLNGDVWCDWQPRAFARPLSGKAHLLLVDNPEHHPEGDFWLKNAQVTETKRAGAQRLTYSGIALIDPQLLADQPLGCFPLAPLLRRAMANGEVTGEHHPGRWLDVGTPARLEQLDNWLREESAP